MKTNLKPFDLKAALNDEPVMLRNGTKAYVRHHETDLPVDGDSCLIGFKHDGYQLTWSESGTYYSMDNPAGNDIIGMYPRTRIINGFEVPAPEKVAPKERTTCFHANVTHDHFYLVYTWWGDKADFQALKRGLVFLNKEDAIANAKAMLGIDPNE